MKPDIRKISLFIGLTFFFNWLIAILFYAFGGKWNGSAAVVVGFAYMFVPMIMVVVVQKFIYKEPLRETLDISFRWSRWFLIAWLIPPFLAFATLGISLLFPGVEYSPEMTGMFERSRSILTPEKLDQIENQIDTLPIHPIWIGLLQGLIAGITVNAVAGFGEELGWRGFLQREFSFMGFWRASLLIGFIWGVWHAPLNPSGT